MDLTNTSKFISLVLRHKPEAIGITLDEHGWQPPWKTGRVPHSKRQDAQGGLCVFPFCKRSMADKDGSCKIYEKAVTEMGDGF